MINLNLEREMYEKFQKEHDGIKGRLAHLNSLEVLAIEIENELIDLDIEENFYKTVLLYELGEVLMEDLWSVEDKIRYNIICSYIDSNVKAFTYGHEIEYIDTFDLLPSEEVKDVNFPKSRDIVVPKNIKLNPITRRKYVDLDQLVNTLFESPIDKKMLTSTYDVSTSVDIARLIQLEYLENGNGVTVLDEDYLNDWVVDELYKYDIDNTIEVGSYTNLHKRFLERGYESDEISRKLSRLKDNEIMQIMDYPIEELERYVFTGTIDENWTCFELSEPLDNNSLNAINFMLEHVDIAPIDCMIEVLCRLTNGVFQGMNKEICCRWFYKLRHDLLFKACLNSCGLQFEKESKISEIVFVDKEYEKLTPDYVLKMNDKLYIIEFTVSRQADSAKLRKETAYQNLVNNIIKNNENLEVIYLPFAHNLTKDYTSVFREMILSNGIGKHSADIDEAYYQTISDVSRLVGSSPLSYPILLGQIRQTSMADFVQDWLDDIHSGYTSNNKTYQMMNMDIEVETLRKNKQAMVNDCKRYLSGAQLIRNVTVARLDEKGSLSVIESDDSEMSIDLLLQYLEQDQYNEIVQRLSISLKNKSELSLLTGPVTKSCNQINANIVKKTNACNVMNCRCFKQEYTFDTVVYPCDEIKPTYQLPSPDTSFEDKLIEYIKINGNEGFNNTFIEQINKISPPNAVKDDIKPIDCSEKMVEILKEKIVVAQTKPYRAKLPISLPFVSEVSISTNNYKLISDGILDLPIVGHTRKLLDRSKITAENFLKAKEFMKSEISEVHKKLNLEYKQKFNDLTKDDSYVNLNKKVKSINNKIKKMEKRKKDMFVQKFEKTDDADTLYTKVKKFVNNYNYIINKLEIKKEETQLAELAIMRKILGKLSQNKKNEHYILTNCILTEDIDQEIDLTHYRAQRKLRNDFSHEESTCFRKNDKEVWSFDELTSHVMKMCDYLSSVGDQKGMAITNDKIIKNIKTYENMQHDMKARLDEHTQHYTSTRGHNMLTNLRNIMRNLMEVSQANFSSSYTYYDNCGLSDFVMYVRSGNKATSTKKSKMVKFIYRISQEIYDYLSNHLTTSKFYEKNGQFYCESPWSQYNIQIISNVLTKPYSMALTYSNLLVNDYTEISRSYLYKMFGFQCLLILNQRRKLEALLSKVKYIINAGLATYNDTTELALKLVEEKPADDLMAYCIMAMIKNFKSFVKTTDETAELLIKNQSKIACIFTSGIISNPDNLSLMEYCSRCMTKAPVTRESEMNIAAKTAANNHKAYKKVTSHDDHVGLGELRCKETDITLLTDVCQKDQLYYSYTFSRSIACFADSIMRSKNCYNDVNKEIGKILDTNIEGIIKNRGMRSFECINKGNLGYNIVMKQWLDRINKSQVDLDSLKLKFERNKRKLVVLGEGLTNEENLFKFISLSEDNKTYLEECTDLFNCVDPEGMIKDNKIRWGFIMVLAFKLQWAGSRELWVMAFESRIQQKVVEDVMGILCRHLPNEVISVPSNFRPEMIIREMHETSFKRGKELLVGNSTEDHSKWGEKMNCEKYVVQMNEILKNLLPEFSTIFMNTMYQVVRKKMALQLHFAMNADIDSTATVFGSEKLQEISNYIYSKYHKELPYLPKPNEEKFEEKLVKEEINKTLVLVDQPAPFMMGMFNYLSSFAGAMEQLYTTYLFNKCVSSLSKYQHLINTINVPEIPLMSEDIREIKKQALNEMGLNYTIEEISLFRQETLSVVDVKPMQHSDDSFRKIIGDLNSIKTFYNFMLWIKSINNHKINIYKSGLCLNPKTQHAEYLSIRTINNIMVPTSCKFTMSLEMNCHDGGYTGDIYPNVIANMVQLYTNGGSIEQCQHLIWILTKMCSDFYNIKPEMTHPLLGGQCLHHPLYYILAGSNADLLWLLDNEMEGEAGKLIKIATDNGTDASYSFYIPQIKFDFVNKFQKLKESIVNLTGNMINDNSRWLYKNIRKSTSLIEAVKFVILSDNYNFSLSSSNDDKYYKMSRGLQVCSQRRLYLNGNFYNQKEFIEELQKTKGNGESLLKFISETQNSLREISRHFSSIENKEKLRYQNYTEAHKLLKPQLIRFRPNYNALSIKSDLSTLIAYNKNKYAEEKNDMHMIESSDIKPNEFMKVHHKMCQEYEGWNKLDKSAQLALLNVYLSNNQLSFRGVNKTHRENKKLDTIQDIIRYIFTDCYHNSTCQITPFPTNVLEECKEDMQYIKLKYNLYKLKKFKEFDQMERKMHKPSHSNYLKSLDIALNDFRNDTCTITMDNTFFYYPVEQRRIGLDYFGWGTLNIRHQGNWFILRILNKELQEVLVEDNVTYNESDFLSFTQVIKNVCKSQNIVYSKCLELHVGSSMNLCLIKNMDGDYVLGNPMGLLISYPRIKKADYKPELHEFKMVDMFNYYGPFNITHFSYAANVSALDSELLKIMPEGIIEEYIKTQDHSSRYERLDHICHDKTLKKWYDYETIKFKEFCESEGVTANTDTFLEYLLSDIQENVYIYPENRKGLLSYIYSLDSNKTRDVEEMQESYKSLTLKISVESDPEKINVYMQQQNRLKQHIREKTKQMILRNVTWLEDLGVGVRNMLYTPVYKRSGKKIHSNAVNLKFSSKYNTEDLNTAFLEILNSVHGKQFAININNLAIWSHNFQIKSMNDIMSSSFYVLCYQIMKELGIGEMLMLVKLYRQIKGSGVRIEWKGKTKYISPLECYMFKNKMAYVEGRWLKTGKRILPTLGLPIKIRDLGYEKCQKSTIELDIDMYDFGLADTDKEDMNDMMKLNTIKYLDMDFVMKSLTTDYDDDDIVLLQRLMAADDKFANMLGALFYKSIEEITRGNADIDDGSRVWRLLLSCYRSQSIKNPLNMPFVKESNSGYYLSKLDQKKGRPNRKPKINYDKPLPGTRFPILNIKYKENYTLNINNDNAFWMSGYQCYEMVLNPIQGRNIISSSLAQREVNELNEFDREFKKLTGFSYIDNCGMAFQNRPLHSYFQINEVKNLENQLTKVMGRDYKLKIENIVYSNKYVLLEGEKKPQLDVLIPKPSELPIQLGSYINDIDLRTAFNTIGTNLTNKLLSGKVVISQSWFNTLKEQIKNAVRLSGPNWKFVGLTMAGLLTNVTIGTNEENDNDTCREFIDNVNTIMSHASLSNELPVISGDIVPHVLRSVY